MKAYPQIDALLDQTENAQRCAHSSDPLIQKGLYRRYRAGDLARPYPGLFARAEYWNQLNEPEQSLHAARTLSRLHPNWVFAGITAAAAHGFDHPRFLHRQGLTITLPNHGSYRTTNSISSTAHIPEKMRYSQTESMSLIPLVPYWTVDGR